MRYLRNNTATIVGGIGPFLDKTDGVTLETALTITNERITFMVDNNDGSAPTLVLDNVTGATSGTNNDLNYVANNDAALMQMEFTAANVNYFGRAKLTITDAANHCPVWEEFIILPQVIYDAMILGTDLFQVDVTQIAGAAVSTSTAQLGVNAVQAGATAWGSGAITAASIATGAITNAKFAAGAIDAAAVADGAIDAATFAAGAITAGAIAADAIGASELAADAVTEIAAGVWQDAVAGDFTVESSIGKSLYTGNVVPGAANGHFIAGTNAATTITTALTTTFTGNLTGSVGSVTGAVGSVAANGITATSLATDAINAASVQAAAVTKIQTGLATPTNITAGTITTVTNLTNERGKYQGGAVWIGPTANTNTVSYTDGIITNPVSTIAAAKTIADALGMRRFEVIRTGAVLISAALAGYRVSGVGWSGNTTGGSQDVGTTAFIGGNITAGTFASTTGTINWVDCEFSTGVTVGVSNLLNCRFAGTLTLSTAGNYDFIDCASVVAGTGTPVFEIPAGTVNVSFRRWSGGISITGITSGTIISIDMVSGGTVTLAGADGNVQVRGMAAGITDNRTGTPTLGQNAAINITKINAEVVDALATDTYAEPGQGTPAATTSLAAKINFLYKAWRNRITQTATTYSLYNDDATTVDQKATVSDNGTTYDKGETVTGA